MDELIGFAVEQIAAAAKKKRAEGQRAQPEGSPDAQERYRRMLQQLQQRQLAQAPAAPPPAPPPVRAAPPVEPKAAPQTAHDREEAAAKRTSSGALRGFLEDGNSLLRAVVAAEVLSPPLALRENPLWQIRRPNEPST